MRAPANVSAVENQILTESLIRVARVRPWVAMVMAEVLEADEHELGRFADGLTPEEARFALDVVTKCFEETGGGHA